MSEITVAVDDDLMNALRKSAELEKKSIEEVARHGLAVYFARAAEFREITEYLLHKNEELYRRLAR